MLRAPSRLTWRILPGGATRIVALAESMVACNDKNKDKDNGDDNDQGEDD